MPIRSDYVEKTRRLPIECTRCFKVLIFDFEVTPQLVEILNSLAKEGVSGKFNHGVVVFYIRGEDYKNGKKGLFTFLRVLEERVNGTVSPGGWSGGSRARDTREGPPSSSSLPSWPWSRPIRVNRDPANARSPRLLE
jgi:hypothetical protein